MFIAIDLKRLIKVAVIILGIVAALLALILLTDKDDSTDVLKLSSGYTLVIDAGHGGIDGGAVAVNGAKESDINLSIAQKTEAIAALFGINTVMTRSCDEDICKTESYSEHDNLIKRAEIANSSPDAVLISIHQNTFPTPDAKGAEVMFAETEGSGEFGFITQNNLVEFADPNNRRVSRPAPRELLLTSSVRCPAILVECGFLSNPEEADKLSDDSYRLKLAVILCASFIQYANRIT